jgi:hypothetical protein
MDVKTFPLIVTFCLFVYVATAQNALPDSSVHPKAEGQVISDFNQAIGEQSEFYNGRRYYLLPQAFKGSPYFLASVSFEPAVINYNNIWYKNVPLLYDAYTDLMVSSLGNVLYSFRKEKLHDIYLAGHHFIFLDSLKSLNLSAGYYDQLYSGSAEVIVKRSRTVVKRTNGQSIETLYEDKNEIYIKRGGAYFPVSSKHSVLKVFKDKVAQLKEYLSSNKIPYRKDRENSVAKLAAYYDKISR